MTSFLLRKLWHFIKRDRSVGRLQKSLESAKLSVKAMNGDNSDE